MLTLAITSGKGGVGKSTLSANLGTTLAQLGERVVLFDADLQLANLDIVCNVQPQFNLQHVANGEKSLAEILTETPAGVKIASGGSAIPMLMTAGPKRLGSFLGQLAQLERTTDILIFDTAAGLDNRVLTFLKLAEHTLVVATPDPSSLTDAYATIKTLFRRDPGAQVSLILNQCGEPEGRALAQTVQDTCWEFLGKTVNYLGSVRHDAQVTLAVRRRQLFVESAPDGKASEDIRALAQAVRDWKDHIALSA